MTDEVPALGISYKADFAADPNSSKDVRPRSIVFQTHVANDVAPDALNELLDKLRVALERQTAVYDLEIARKELGVHLKNLRQLESASQTVEEVARLRFQEQGRKGEWDPDKHLTHQEKQARTQNEGSLRSWREGAIFWDSEVKRLQEIVYVDDGGPDRSTE